jgi:hypothetical protein
MTPNIKGRIFYEENKKRQARAADERTVSAAVRIYARRHNFRLVY